MKKGKKEPKSQEGIYLKYVYSTIHEPYVYLIPHEVVDSVGFNGEKLVLASHVTYKLHTYGDLGIEPRVEAVPKKGTKKAYDLHTFKIAFLRIDFGDKYHKELFRRYHDGLDYNNPKDR